LLEGADAEAITKAIELALFYEARLDVRWARGTGFGVGKAYLKG